MCTQNHYSFVLLLCLFLFACDEETNPASGSNEIDIDWVLINVPELFMSYTPEYDEEGNLPDMPLATYFTFNGYILLATNSSGILGDDDVTIDDNGQLTFTYNESNYSYDISDSYYEEGDIYTCEIYTEDMNRIILNTELNYIMYFMGEGDGGNFNLSSPNELIDYR